MKKKKKIRLAGYLFSFAGVLLLCSSLQAQASGETSRPAQAKWVEEVKLYTPSGRKVWVTNDSSLFQYLDRGYERVGKSRRRKMKGAGDQTFGRQLLEQLTLELTSLGVDALRWYSLERHYPGWRFELREQAHRPTKRGVTPGLALRYRFP